MTSSPLKAQKRSQSMPLHLQSTNSDTRRQAAAVLEVLAGERTPSDAAAALEISLARYYSIEARALSGMIEACQPRGKGRMSAPEKELTALRKEVERLRRESARKQALLRASQRAIGLASPPQKGTGKRRRRRTVRALTAASMLRSQTETSPSETEAAIKQT